VVSRQEPSSHHPTPPHPQPTRRIPHPTSFLPTVIHPADDWNVNRTRFTSPLICENQCFIRGCCSPRLLSYYKRSVSPQPTQIFDLALRYLRFLLFKKSVLPAFIRGQFLSSSVPPCLCVRFSSLCFIRLIRGFALVPALPGCVIRNTNVPFLCVLRRFQPTSSSLRICENPRLIGGSSYLPFSCLFVFLVAISTRLRLCRAGFFVVPSSSWLRLCRAG